jgi:lipopolysaccharide/colanic/teichoic acid biosynthesis glycosyltransferase
VVVAWGVFVVLSPLIATALISILCIDKQNPIFLQKRTIYQKNTDGSDKIFTILKMRTMKDGEVTRLGHILRKYSVDELLQLLNVCLWDMSIVGPRPAPIHTESEAHQIYQWWVLPWLTGLYQVQSKKSERDNHHLRIREKFIYNRFYSHKIWFNIDIYILLKTIKILLQGKNS